jgi:hypothetical protein
VYPQFVLSRSEQSTVSALKGGSVYAEARAGWTGYAPIAGKTP